MALQRLTNIVRLAELRDSLQVCPLAEDRRASSSRPGRSTVLINEEGSEETNGMETLVEAIRVARETRPARLFARRHERATGKW